jgi:hypothetical protein
MTRLLLAAALLAAGQAQAKSDRCFNAYVGGNSRTTTAIFKRRRLQGGGPTWAAILEAQVKSYTTFIREQDHYSDDMPGFGSPIIVTFRKAQTWYILDDEGDGAIFCAGDRALLEAVRADYVRLNKDSKALEQALDRLGPEIE